MIGLDACRNFRRGQMMRRGLFQGSISLAHYIVYVKRWISGDFGRRNTRRRHHNIIIFRHCFFP